MAFNPNEHMSKLKGKDYLEVKWRLVWFREDHPAESGWGIKTNVVQFDERMATVQAVITDPEGRVVASGTKQEQPAHFSDYLEKAETGAIGRALAALGYGTQFAPELEEEERIVDSPVNRTSQKPAEPLANEQHLQTLLGERKKREGGWQPILDVLKLKGMPALEGKPKEEQEQLMGEYMHRITVTEANDILRAIRALPYKSAGAPKAEEGD